jgi:AraC-like DNA-binding protein
VRDVRLVFWSVPGTPLSIGVSLTPIGRGAMPLRDPALIAAGFSLVAAVLLGGQLPLDRRVSVVRTRTAGAAGLVLLGALALCQWAYFEHLLYGSPPLGRLDYRIALFLVAPAGFLLADSVLRSGRALRLWDGLHLLPAAVAWAIPPAWTVPLAFALGAVYLAVLARRLWRLRRCRHLFRLEFWWLVGLLARAAGVVLLGLIRGPDGAAWAGFVSLHALAIGLCLALALVLALRLPHLLETVAEAAESADAEPALPLGPDQAALLAALEQGMRGDAWYLEPELSLPLVAERLGLAPHRLSALLNRGLGLGFSQYLRRLRVEHAQRMLREEPRASVLSVGLAVGFSSQSNFYEAFREVTGEAPGRFRRRIEPTDP